MGKTLKTTLVFALVIFGASGVLFERASATDRHRTYSTEELSNMGQPKPEGTPSTEDNRHPLLKALDRLPPLPEAEREAFDKAAMSMWDKNCRCLTFLLDGEVRSAKLPLNDTDRRLLIDGIRDGYIIPLEKKNTLY